MSQEKLSSELHMKINENDSILDSLGEPKQITERRNTLQAIIKTLKESLKILQRDPDITAASSVDDGELGELLRKEANDRKKQTLDQKAGVQRPIGQPMPNQNMGGPGPNNRPPPQQMN